MCMKCIKSEVFPRLRQTCISASHPLSRYLSNLENELGVNLFVRTLNGTELTAAGKIYLEYAKEIKLLKENDELQAEKN